MKKVQLPLAGFQALHNLAPIYPPGFIFSPKSIPILTSYHMPCSFWFLLRLAQLDCLPYRAATCPARLRSNILSPWSHTQLSCLPTNPSLQRILEEWVLYIVAVTLYAAFFSPACQSKFWMPGTTFNFFSTVFLRTRCNMMMHRRC